MQTHPAQENGPDRSGSALGGQGHETIDFLVKNLRKIAPDRPWAARGTKPLIFKVKNDEKWSGSALGGQGHETIDF